MTSASHFLGTSATHKSFFKNPKLVVLHLVYKSLLITQLTSFIFKSHCIQDRVESLLYICLNDVIRLFRDMLACHFLLHARKSPGSPCRRSPHKSQLPSSLCLKKSSTTIQNRQLLIQFFHADYRIQDVLCGVFLRRIRPSYRLFKPDSERRLRKNGP